MPKEDVKDWPVSEQMQHLPLEFFPTIAVSVPLNLPGANVKLFY
jgi:hypothetical protein